MPKIINWASFETLKFAVKQCYQTGVKKINYDILGDFWVIFVYFSIVSQPCHHGQASMKQCNQRAGIFALDAEK